MGPASADNASTPLAGLLPWQSCFLAFAAGIFAYRSPVEAGLFLVVLSVADPALRGPIRRLPLFIFVLCAAFGFGYATQRTPAPVETPGWIASSRPVVVRGVVDRVDPREGHGLRLILRDMTCLFDEEDSPLPGRLVWNWRHPSSRPLPGQSLEVRLRVVPVRSFGNPGGWDYQWYWLRQNIQWRGWTGGKPLLRWGERPSGTTGALKDRLRLTVARLLPETPGGALVLALVTGDRSSLDAVTTDAVRAAGLAHTLALSGLHVGFVAAMGMALAWIVGLLHPPLLLRLPRPKLAVILAAPLVLGYVWLGQPSASLVRAATMYGFWGFLLLQGRGRVLLDGLFFALTVIVFIDPLSVFDLSLQMSALAVVGIGLLYPRLRPMLVWGGRGWRRVVGFGLGVLAVSLCATISLLPLVAWYFGAVSPNILLNVIWIPVLGCAVMPLGLVGLLLSFVPAAAHPAALFLGLAARIMDQLLAVLNAVNQAGLTPVLVVLRPLWPESLGFGLLLVVALAAWSNRRVAFGLAGIGFVLLSLPHLLVMASDTRDEVRLTLMDVGLGQAVVVSTPGGHRWLVDGGGGSRTFDLGEAVVGPWLALGRPPRLDGVIMSHPDNDHSRGLSHILGAFQVGAFYTNGMLPHGESGRDMRLALVGSGLEPVPLGVGQRVPLGGEASFEVLHPPVNFGVSGSNECSLVLRLVDRGRGLAVLPGDVEGAGTRAALASGLPLRAEVLVLPHHGSRSSLSVPFLRAVDAGAVLCSDGFMNRFGFPHAEVVEALAAPLYTTSRHGQITVVWRSGSSVAIHAELP
jgi:competence protein ComEC